MKLQQPKREAPKWAAMLHLFTVIAWNAGGRSRPSSRILMIWETTARCSEKKIASTRISTTSNSFNSPPNIMIWIKILSNIYWIRGTVITSKSSLALAHLPQPPARSCWSHARSHMVFLNFSSRKQLYLVGADLRKENGGFDLSGSDGLDTCKCFPEISKLIVSSIDLSDPHYQKIKTGLRSLIVLLILC